MIEKRKNKIIKFYILAVIILLIFLHYLNVLNPVERYFLSFLTQGQGESYTFFTKLKYSFVNYQEAQDLKKENKLLKEEKDTLLYENSQLNSYKLENEKLRKILNFVENKKFTYQLADVIGQGIDRNNILLINKGKNHGVKVGYAAVVDEGVMIGKVIEVKNNTATILLLTDNLSQLTVATNTTNQIAGLARGEYGLSIQVDYIPQDLEIKDDELIITSGSENNIPRGLLVGKVNRIISQDNDLFKSVKISPLVNYDEITFLSVIIPNSNPDD